MITGRHAQTTAALNAGAPATAAQQCPPQKQTPLQHLGADGRLQHGSIDTGEGFYRPSAEPSPRAAPQMQAATPARLAEHYYRYSCSLGESFCRPSMHCAVLGVCVCLAVAAIVSGSDAGVADEAAAVLQWFEKNGGTHHALTVEPRQDFRRWCVTCSCHCLW
jgi:hypothetical protein